MRAEEKYRAQLQELGVWQEAFAPAVHDLCMMEREARREQKAWQGARDALDGVELGTREWRESVKAVDGHMALLQQLRRDILSYRDALGLTAKGLTRLRGRAGDGPAESAGAGVILLGDVIAEAGSGGEDEAGAVNGGGAAAGEAEP